MIFVHISNNSRASTVFFRQWLPWWIRIQIMDLGRKRRLSIIIFLCLSTTTMQPTQRELCTRFSLKKNGNSPKYVTNAV